MLRVLWAVYVVEIANGWYQGTVTATHRRTDVWQINVEDAEPAFIGFSDESRQ